MYICIVSVSLSDLAFSLYLLFFVRVKSEDTREREGERTWSKQGADAKDQTRERNKEEEEGDNGRVGFL